MLLLYSNVHMPYFDVPTGLISGSQVVSDPERKVDSINFHIFKV